MCKLCHASNPCLIFCLQKIEANWQMLDLTQTTLRYSRKKIFLVIYFASMKKKINSKFCSFLKAKSPFTEKDLTVVIYLCRTFASTVCIGVHNSLFGPIHKLHFCLQYGYESFLPCFIYGNGLLDVHEI